MWQPRLSQPILYADLYSVHRSQYVNSSRLYRPYQSRNLITDSIYTLRISNSCSRRRCTRSSILNGRRRSSAAWRSLWCQFQSSSSGMAQNCERNRNIPPIKVRREFLSPVKRYPTPVRAPPERACTFAFPFLPHHTPPTSLVF